MLMMTDQTQSDFREIKEEPARLLVVDDEDINGELFRRMFAHDYHVTLVPYWLSKQSTRCTTINLMRYFLM